MIYKQLGERRQKRRKRNKKVIIRRLLSIIIFLVLIIGAIFLVFFLIKMLLSSRVTEHTKVIEAHSTESPVKLSCKGIVFRTEKIYKAPLNGTLHQIIVEGNRVKKGDTIAKIYNYKEEQELKEKKLSLYKEGFTLQVSFKRYFARWSIKDRVLIERLNKRLDLLKKALLEVKLDEVNLIEKEMEEIAIKRQDLDKDKRKYEDEIKTKFQMLNKENLIINTSLTKEVSSVFTAENDGMISYSFDGSEEKFIPKSILESPMWDIPKFDIKPVNIRNGQIIEKDVPVFRLIQEPWFILTRIPADKKDYFASRVERLIFFNDINVQIYGSIEKIYDKGPKFPEVLSVISLDKLEKQLLSNREISFDLLLSKVTGVTLPVTAKVIKIGDVGVYTVVNGKAKFQSVKVKFDENNQFVVEGLKEGSLVIPDARRVKEGMKIIVEGKM